MVGLMGSSNGQSAPLFQMQGIAKRYGGVQALDGVNLTVHAGRIHAVLGENGAGKSSLIKCMAGVVQPDAGSMTIEGQPVRFRSPAAANAAGVVCVFQELSLVPDLSVADNILISNPPRRLGMIDRRAQRRAAEAALARAGAEGIHPMALVKDLSLSRRQLVEIAKALARDPRLLILDEATSALAAGDVAAIFRVLKDLRAQGLALVYISHRMQEIAELADECSVFRNGRHVATFEAGAKSDDEVVRMMIGRDYSQVFPPKPGEPPSGPPVLELRRLSWAGRLTDISLQVRPGEVVGLGGLDGQGQRELLLALFGVLRGVSGEVLVNGEPASIKGPNEAKQARHGMALIPEDRKTEGLMLPMTVSENLSFASLNRLSHAGIMDRRAERRAINEMLRLLAIKTADTETTPAGSLSGGNQQKVVIAKWLMNAPQIILLNDPTRGIDVGTKQEIYRLLRKLAEEGAAILLYSTDYAELIGCCDRVLVLYDGAIRRELAGAGITEHALVASALNIGMESAHA